MASSATLDTPFPTPTASDGAAKSAQSIPKLKSSFTVPIESILRQLSGTFEQAGDIVEVTGFPVRVFCFRHPDHIAEIFQHPKVGVTKYAKAFPRVKRMMGTGGYILKGGSFWRDRRRQVKTAFKRDYLHRYAEQIPPLTREMLDRWEAYAKSESVFHVCDELQTLITRANFRCFFSEHISGDELDEMRKMTHFIDLNFVRPSPMWLPTPGNRQFSRYARRLRHKFLGLIRQRRRHPADGQDLLSVLINLTDPESGRPWSDEEILGEMFSVYFGASVMSTSLCWAFYLTASHPDVQERMARESEQLLGDRDPNTEALSGMQYANMVLQETFRVYPASWGYPRFCEDGMQVAGHWIPPKSLVIPMVWHAHRHPEYWDNPARFDPERFAPEKKDEIHPYAFLPFGRGERACLGANLAPMVMKPILSMVCHRYHLEFRPRMASDPAAEFGFEIHPRDPMPMRIVARRSGTGVGN